METAKILKKSVLKPGNNWITLLNSANLSKKNAVTPVNFHLYHYAGNNPVRYTDPDGRANVYSYKYGDNRYSFEVDLSTLEGAVKSAYGAIPLGGYLVEFINNRCGFKTINEKDAYARICTIADPILDLADNLDTITNIMSKFVSISNSVLKISNIVSQVAGWISSIKTLLEVAYNFTKKEQVAINQLVKDYFDDCLYSTSHENVAALYVYARDRIAKLVSDGELTYKADWDGFVKERHCSPELIQQIKDELKLLKQYLED